MKVFITVDVESYTGDYEREVWGNGLGLEYLLRQCSQHGTPATYFVEALGATRWGGEPLARICRSILAAGQRVELHLHPSVAQLDGFQDQDDVFWNQDQATQLRLLLEGVRQLKLAGVPEVTAFRAGDLAANEVTLAAMKQAGLSIGAHRNLFVGSSIRTKINGSFPAANDLSRADGIVDIPVTCLRSPLPFLDGPYRHLEVCAVSSQEMCWALDRLQSSGYACAGILTHPPEFFRWNDGRATPIVKNCRRFESLLGFLQQRADMEVCVVDSRVLEMSLPHSSPAVPAWPLWMSLLRFGEQAAFRLRHGAR
ncbi:MAG: hypothetical protein WD872_18670 [Pirellulaceae bacterium]